ncbi:MAG TPA: MraY family glycosyltransferase, partial [Chitinophaga sp.]|nr:MraY family glycosyltransferase [Chitinophaga sp.]
MASFAVIYLGNLQINSMYGLMGMYALPPHFSLLLTYFTFLVIINAFNLIDGVDGLAGSIGMLVSGVLGTYFLYTGELIYAVMGFALAGGLAAFLIYNISPAKIFMGDTGSLLVGLVNAILIVKFIEVGGNPSGKLPLEAVPAIAISILILPLFDTLRVFSIRMMHGRSPFSADRNHIHHYLLALGLNHKQTTLTCVTVNAMYIAAGFVLQDMGATWLLLAVVGSALILTGILYYMKRKKEAVLRALAVSAIRDSVTDSTAITQPKVLRVNPKGMLQDK